MPPMKGRKSTIPKKSSLPRRKVSNSSPLKQRKYMNRISNSRNQASVRNTRSTAMTHRQATAITAKTSKACPTATRASTDPTRGGTPLPSPRRRARTSRSRSSRISTTTTTSLTTLRSRSRTLRCKEAMSSTHSSTMQHQTTIMESRLPSSIQTRMESQSSRRTILL
jgi:hypothetical protein